MGILFRFIFFIIGGIFRVCLILFLGVVLLNYSTMAFAQIVDEYLPRLEERGVVQELESAFETAVTYGDELVTTVSERVEESRNDSRRF